MIFQENNLFAPSRRGQQCRAGPLAVAAAYAGRPRRCQAEALAGPGSPARSSACRANLSGGERQRVAVCPRAGARDRPVLLLDEPFAALGPALRDDMLGPGLRRCRPSGGMTVLLVTHHPEDARRVADHMVFVEDGKVAATGPTAQFFAYTGPKAFRRYIGK